MKKLILVVMMMVMSVLVMAEGYGYETEYDQHNLPEFIKISTGDNCIDEEINRITYNAGFTIDDIEKGIIETYPIYKKVVRLDYAETQSDMNAYTDFLIWMSMYANRTGDRVNDRTVRYESYDKLISLVVGEAMNNHMRTKQNQDRVYKIGAPHIDDDLRHYYLDRGPLHVESMYKKWTTGDDFYFNTSFMDILKMRIYNILCRVKPEE